jgi:hypothetical protein
MSRDRFSDHILVELTITSTSATDSVSSGFTRLHVAARFWNATSSARELPCWCPLKSFIVRTDKPPPRSQT